ncbi:tRNA 2'-phosphotransferase 1 [Coemansia javaensis]|uniref:2'-phosphotransferase n=1 Tax=Coemansia javaensis TaxID=2761396 RepID=A0A9W8HFP9_9FUNG|nr:tRNA 2'-phosphotransferase 1 [Coemansia javaensis]
MAHRSSTGGPGRRGPRREDPPEVRLSKFLSYVLRHGATKEGLALRSDGSVALDDLMKHAKLRATTFEQIRHVVDTNSKKRFALFQEGPDQRWFIRAVQGHSLEVTDLPLIRITADSLPGCIIHGTLKSRLPAIQQTGLSRMGRTHIHFTSGLPADGSVISGMRSTADVFIYIDRHKAMADGIEFYRSDNGVILSTGKDNSGTIPPEYFERVVHR